MITPKTTHQSPSVEDAVFMAFPTELGWAGIHWQQQPTSKSRKANQSWHIRRLTFGHPNRRRVLDVLPVANDGQVALSKDQVAAKDSIAAYAAGEPIDLARIAIAYGDRTPFQKSVLKACREVPWGETRTYGELADMAGYPRSARAVGNVMASNIVPLLIPCHRIVPSGKGKLGGFTAPGGVSMKRRLLELEACSEMRHFRKIAK